MNRRVRFAVVAAALLVALFGFAPNAQAQQDNVCTVYNSATGLNDAVACNDGTGFAEAFQGGGDTAEVDPAAAAAAATADADADAAAAAEDTAAPQLAFTGAESEVLAYIGSGMIALGAMAFIAQRRITRD